MNRLAQSSERKEKRLRDREETRHDAGLPADTKGQRSELIGS